VNASIFRLSIVMMLLLISLIVATSWWTVGGAQGVRDNALNARPILQELKIDRGPIKAADGTVLARSVSGPGGTFERRYPLGSLFAHPVGYSNAALGQRAGLEQSEDDALTGRDDAVGSFFDELRGHERKGDTVVTSLQAAAQRAAYAGLAGRKGAVVALDPRTGAVEALAANPSYDPQHPTRGGSQFDRATQSGYPPGSTFKAVTAVAAIDTGKFTPNSFLNGRSPQVISGTPLSNDGNESFGTISLTEALTQSVNTVWAQVAVKVGRPAMTKYMKRFGFYRKVPLDIPSDQRVASHVVDFKGRVREPTSDQVDLGRVGIGQGGLEVTPLQMAMVASAIANGGELMTPHLVSRTVDPDGRTRHTTKPTVYAHVMKRSTAAAVGVMMQSVVKEGTGTAAALTGIDVAGKTGTAEVGCNGRKGVQTWFIAFAPAVKPRVAVATTVECSGGVGGTVAAPIAKSVMEAVLHG
jgi:penicillin-binding protein A